MVKSIGDVIKKVDTSVLMERELTDWRPILTEECQVYVYGENYIAKKFDQINYRFCSKDEAKEILVDNLYAILRFKYFPYSSDETDEKINDIIKSFIANLKTSLKKVSFDVDADCEKVKSIPRNCVAFRNGVYDFFNNEWLFKYDVVEISSLRNKIYMYDPSYLILWYININFDPLPVSIMDTSLEDFINIMKELSKDTNSNYCFKLMYNIAHDRDNIFSLSRFNHLSEIMGYSILQDFCQSFVMLIGTGGNGKNSLFDGCFIPYVRPMPASNNLDAIENDKFITGALENRYQNIYLESDPKTYDKSTVLKSITGSPYQTIEQKGVSKYSGFLNCKHIFSANDQDKIKFADTTSGFKRRINMFEIFYHWDEKRNFMKKGDYYDTTFSEDLHEIKDDITNTILYIYFGMYGIKSATKNFTRTFKFSDNDWNDKYSDLDTELKDKIENISINQIIRLMKTGPSEDNKTLLFDENKKRLYQSSTFTELGYNGYNDLIEMLENDETRINYFVNNDVFINVKILHSLCGGGGSPTSFTQNIKKIYGIENIPFTYNNRPYIKCNFVNRKIKILM